MAYSFPILQVAPEPVVAHPHEAFAAATALEYKLKKTVKGEVRFDQASRALYATDASNFRQVPIGLVIPRDVEDVIATLAACREYGAPVLSRGGGTNLAGQCCNVAVVLDFSKYVHSLVHLDAGRRLANVQPGMILDALRTEAELHDLTLCSRSGDRSRCTSEE